MSSFVIVRDPLRERCASFAAAARRHISPVAGLSVGSYACDDSAACWAANPRVPSSSTVARRGLAVVLGEALCDSEGTRLGAEELLRQWRAHGSRGGDDLPGPWDGFHVAFAHEPGTGWAVWSDALGIYPVYYFHRGDLFVAASSPELLRLHPCVGTTVDAQGLAGILMAGHIVGGRTLLKGVTRLGAGNALLCGRDGRVREAKLYSPTTSTRYFDLPLSAQIKIYDRTFEAAVGRHCPRGTRYRLMLSGGRDSRMLAGYLARLGRDFDSWTLGAADDVEMECAARVARKLGVRHRADEVAAASFVEYALLQARWEHLANGFNTIIVWGHLPLLGRSRRAPVVGYLCGSLAGGFGMDWSLPPGDGPPCFRSFYRRVQAWGFGEADVRRLLAPWGVEGRQGVGAVREYVRDAFAADGPVRSGWLFTLLHRERLHVGAAAWRQSFRAWPRIPMLDRAVVELAAGMPPASLAERRLQDELIGIKFPRLADLPFEGVLRALAEGRLTPLRRLRGAGACDHLRRHRIHRLSDLNNKGWTAVRREADRHRRKLDGLLDAGAVERLLPRADVPVRLSTEKSSGLKTLIGLLLWARQCA